MTMTKASCRTHTTRHLLAATLLASIMLLSGCASTIIGTAVDATIEVAKVPFKVGGAVVDVVTGDEED